MNINLSEETIKTVYDSLKSTEQTLQYNLKYGNLCGEMNQSKRDIFENKLSNVQEALQVFEELMLMYRTAGLIQSKHRKEKCMILEWNY